MPVVESENTEFPADLDHAVPPLARLLGELFPGDPKGAAILARLTRAERQGHTGIVVPPREATVLGDLVGSGGDGEDPRTPLILDGDWLATRRAWNHERILAQQLIARATTPGPKLNDPALDAALAAAFPPSERALSEQGVDWQRAAAGVALAHGLALITGGPGCGKTAVAGRIAALLAGHHARTGRPVPTVVLAAPTGKAAGRLVESVRRELARSDLDSATQTALTSWSTTLHRLFNDPRCAQVDLAIIDETSMASAATLARVLVRIPAAARVLLLGDPDQLASVEPGRVLGDLARLPAHHPIAPRTVRLRVNWRSGAAPALAALVKALQQDDPTAPGLLETPAPDPADPNPWIHRTDPPGQPSTLIHRLIADHRDWLERLARAENPAAALALAEEVRLLTVLRQGPWGADALNAQWERHLLAARHLRPDAHGHFPGRLLLVTGNRPDLDLANGDVGIVWPAPAGDHASLAAYFPGVGGVRAVSLHRLDGVIPAWFLTVHKAQGSQGDLVEVIGLPQDASPGQRQLATREMAYTAITRAARRLRVWWDAPGLAQALKTRESQRRTSGLPIHLTREAQVARATT